MWYTPNAYNQKGADQLENIAYTSSNSSNTKKQPTNHTLSRIILATILPVLPVSSINCRNHTKVKEPTPVVAPRDYTIEDLVATLGARWDLLNNEQKDMFREAWSTAKDKIKRFMVEVYSDPNEVYNRLSEDNRNRFDAFKVSELDEEKIKRYKGAFPWMDIKNPELPDKMIIYTFDRIGYILNLR